MVSGFPSRIRAELGAVEVSGKAVLGNWKEKEKSCTYPKVVKYLLSNYASDEIIAEF